MAELRARDLRNDLSAVLRRVEAGERMRITLRGRPVAELIPVGARPQSMSLEAFLAALESNGADAGLLDDLREALPGDTSDLRGA